MEIGDIRQKNKIPENSDLERWADDILGWEGHKPNPEDSGSPGGEALRRYI